MKSIKEELMENFKEPTFYKSWDKSKFKDILEKNVEDKNIIKVNLGIEETDYCLKNLPEKVTSKIKDNAIIDIGTGWGDSLLIFNQYSPKLIDCFECNRTIFRILNKIILPYKNMNASNVAMEEYGDQELLVRWKDKEKSDSDIAWNVDHADTFIVSYALKHLVYNIPIALIKINAGSSTTKILKGGKDFFKRYKPNILIIESSYDQKTFDFIPKFIKEILPEYKHKVVTPNSNENISFKEDYYNLFYRIDFL